MGTNLRSWRKLRSTKMTIHDRASSFVYVYVGYPMYTMATDFFTHEFGVDYTFSDKPVGHTSARISRDHEECSSLYGASFLTGMFVLTRRYYRSSMITTTCSERIKPF
jgi:hypothetical protein